MKGVNITELLLWSSKAFSPAVADALRAGVESNGQPSSITDFAHPGHHGKSGGPAPMSEPATANPAPTYSNRLAARVAAVYPDLFAGVDDAKNFLSDIDGYIHGAPSIPSAGASGASTAASTKAKP